MCAWGLGRDPCPPPGDPTHVRPITPQSLLLFDKQKNEEWVAGGVSAATPLGLYIGVDFFIAGLITVLDPVYHEHLVKEELTLEQISQKSRELNNVIAEYHITLVVRKS